MFYSNFIFVKKGPLSKVWLAAHWQRRLTKAHVNGTDIDLSAKTILDPKTPLALRLSGQLLLGLVRIYQRKVKYLQEDASDALTKMKMVFRPGIVDLPADSRIARPHDITLPDTIELEFAIPDLPMGMGDLDGLLLGDADFHRKRGTGEAKLSPSETKTLPAVRAQDITLDEEKDHSRVDINLPEEMEQEPIDMEKEMAQLLDIPMPAPEEPDMKESEALDDSLEQPRKDGGAALDDTSIADDQSVLSNLTDGTKGTKPDTMALDVQPSPGPALVSPDSDAVSDVPEQKADETIIYEDGNPKLQIVFVQLILYRIPGDAYRQ